MTTPLPEEKLAALRAFIFSGEKIAAIKLYREITGFGLKEAKEAVEALEASLRKESPEKFTAPRAKGCFGAAAVFCLGAATLDYGFAQG